jgi:hypothetical protein
VAKALSLNPTCYAAVKAMGKSNGSLAVKVEKVSGASFNCIFSRYTDSQHKYSISTFAALYQGYWTQDGLIPAPLERKESGSLHFKPLS